MPLPYSISVKLSSEAAGAISVTPVVVQEMPLRDLVEHLLGMVGKDEARIREILLRGSLVVGGSRFRWQGWAPEPEGLGQVLATFPDPDPTRPFARERCTGAILCGNSRRIEIPREAGSLWDVLLTAAETNITYAGYSYRERADWYAKSLTFPEREQLSIAAAKLRSHTLREQILTGVFDRVEFYLRR